MVGTRCALAECWPGAHVGPEQEVTPNYLSPEEFEAWQGILVAATASSVPASSHLPRLAFGTARLGDRLADIETFSMLSPSGEHQRVANALQSLLCDSPAGKVWRRRTHGSSNG